MSNSFSLPDGHNVAQVDLHPNGIYGSGRSELPVLIASLRFLFRCPKRADTSLNFRELRCRVSPFETTYIATSLPTPIELRIASESTLSDHIVNLQIPMDRTRLALINRLRNGGDVKLRLDMELVVDELVAIGRQPGTYPEIVWGLKEHYRMECRLPVVIARSDWLERVLPQTEFAKIHIIELPAISLDKCAGMKIAMEALQQAQTLEAQGHYNEAVGRCRIALEVFFEKVEKTDAKGEKIKVPVLKPSWEMRLGKATYDWLNAAMVTMKGPTNKPHHHSSVFYDQLEAQILLTVTTALVAYAVKVGPETEQT